MKFLNGWKTIIGVIGTVATVLVPKLDPAIIPAIGDHAVGLIQGAFGLLTALGIIHKVEKATGSGT
jgi:hypothetical protein